jgi:hypothetical protein
MQNINKPGRTGTTKDLTDSPKDKSEMQEPAMTIIDLPDVKDIPGQENVVPAPLGEMADDTLASSDEEGDELFDDDIDTEIEENSDSNVSAAEKEDLQITANDMPTEDDMNLREAALDNTDNDGVPLNEGSLRNNLSGRDLDVPGSEEDDEDEEMGEEDEENNDYSLGGDNHDDIPGDSF